MKIQLIYFRGIASGIYASNSPEACLHCLRISDASIVIVENDDQLQKILKVQNQAPKLEIIVQINGTPKHDSVLSVNIILKLFKCTVLKTRYFI